MFFKHFSFLQLTSIASQLVHVQGNKALIPLINQFQLIFFFLQFMAVLKIDKVYINRLKVYTHEKHKPVLRESFI